MKFDHAYPIEKFTENAEAIVDLVNESGRSALITRDGRVIVGIIPINDDEIVTADPTDKK